MQMHFLASPGNSAPAASTENHIERYAKIDAAGSVAERFKALVLKTSDGQPSVSSNLTASAVSTVSHHVLLSLIPRIYAVSA
jgi:hypothetical protein